MKRRKPTYRLLAVIAFVSGCERSPLPVAGPFYLNILPDSSEVALWRCPDGPNQGCAVDGLPMKVTAAGGSKDFITVQNDRGYYYFHRTNSEFQGWGGNPETIIGPLSEAEFTVIARKLSLPDLTVRF